MADITRSKDLLYLKPGNAVGTAMPEGIPVCYRSTKPTVFGDTHCDRALHWVCIMCRRMQLHAPYVIKHRLRTHVA